MDKIKFVGGLFEGITLQAPNLPKERVYLGGLLYAWDGTKDDDYRVFHYNPILALGNDE